MSRPSSSANFLFAAVLGFLGAFNLATGIVRGVPGDLVSGLAAAIYAIVLLRDGVHLQKTGKPALSQAKMTRVGLACLALYFFGVLIERAPEMFDVFG